MMCVARKIAAAACACLLFGATAPAAEEKAPPVPIQHRMPDGGSCIYDNAWFSRGAYAPNGQQCFNGGWIGFPDKKSIDEPLPDAQVPPA